MGGKRNFEKKKGGGKAEKKREDAFVVQEVQKALKEELEFLKKRMTLEPTSDTTEKQVRLVVSILKMNVSALVGTMQDQISEKATDAVFNATKERRLAVNRLIAITKNFEQKKHKAEEFDEEAKTALNQLADVFVAFGPDWDTIRNTIVQMAMDQLADIKSWNPLHKEKAELERLEKQSQQRADKEMKKEKERKAMEKAEKEKEKKSNKKKSKKCASSITTDDFGEERVPPQIRHTCCCPHRHSMEHHETPVMGSEGLSTVPTDPSLSRSRTSSTSTFSSPDDDLPAVAHIMTNEQWAQFCRVYRGPK